MFTTLVRCQAGLPGRAASPRERSFVPRLAIVISAVGNVQSLEGTLISVLENRPADCEIVVALNRPYADPYELKGEVHFVTARGATVAGINQALAVTRAPFVHLLASGCQVTEGWTDEALARFGNRRVGSVAPMVWNAERTDRIFAAGIGFRTNGTHYLVGKDFCQLTPELERSIIGPCGFAAFYRKAAIDFAGGWSNRLGTRQADLDIALALRRAGLTVAIEQGSRILATAQADPGEGIIRQALHDERLFWRNLPVEGRMKSLAAHAAFVGIEMLSGIGRPRMFSRLAARAWACCELSSHARHRWALKQLGQHTASMAPTHGDVRIDRPHTIATVGEPSKASAPSR